SVTSAVTAAMTKRSTTPKLSCIVPRALATGGASSSMSCAARPGCGHERRRHHRCRRPADREGPASHDAPGFAYTPSATSKYEAPGRLAAQLAMDGQPPIATPVRAEIVIDLPVPASWSAKRRDAALRGDVRPTSRPDADNYVKAALDAVNAIVVADDSL